jgi:hypothetical protein
MHIDQRKEQFSRAYVLAVAAAAGYAWYQPSVDDDSIDLGLAEKGGGGTVRSPRLELQLKCHAAETPVGTHFSHDLKVKNYEDLRDTTVQVPRILIVVLVPENVASWVVASENELAMRRCGYWISLRGSPATTNLNTVAVSIPRAQVFHPQSLSDIMTRIGGGLMP